MAIAQKSRLAVHGGSPVRNADKKWPTWPVFDDTERRALMEVLDSGKWWYGERVAKFETDFAAYQDAKYCVSCTSGTTAAEICLQAFGIGAGDEVIVPPYTFIATASTVARMGATPVFVDIDESWCMNPQLIEQAITPRTKAIVPVHFGGRIADMDRINAIAAKHGLIVIEDACHSWGGKWKGKGTGALGRCGVFSFQASKNLNAAEGGAILTDDETVADTCRSITNCGRVKGSAWYSHEAIGTNARLTEFAGALLSAQFTRLEAQSVVRETNAATLDAGLKEIDGIEVQPGDPRITRRPYHLYGLRIDPERFGCSRDKVVDAAKAEGLPCGPGYPEPLYKQPVFAARKSGFDYSTCACPVTEDVCYRSGFWFPHFLLLGSSEDMNDIIRIFNKIKEHAGELSHAD